jgi:MFS family permease
VSYTDDAIGTATIPPRKDPTSRLAWVTFAVLFFMNLLDYTDRWVLAGMLPKVSDDLRLDDFHAGLLATWFLASYALVGPLMGFAGDRFKRTRLLAIGVGIWSVATICSGLAQTYGQLSMARALLGVGEAVNGVITPTILMDLFPREKRARVLSYFYLAMPLGGALGLTLGGYVAEHYGWHVAFFIVATPGLFAALATAFLPDPVRGQSEGVDAVKLLAHEQAGASREDYIDLMVNSSFTYSVLGMAFYTFAIGGLAYWLPTFLIRDKVMDPVASNFWLGIMTLFAAISGMSAGGWLSDRLAKISSRALFLVPGVAMLGSVPFILLVVYAKTPALIFAGVFFAEALMFINTGPCNAVIANVVMPNMRAAAYSVAIFAVHFLGDIWSPTLMGWVSSTFGQSDAMASIFGQFLQGIGALPSVREGQLPRNLTAAMLVVIPAVVLSGIVLLAGARHLPREMALMLAKLKANPTHIQKPGGLTASSSLH